MSEPADPVWIGAARLRQLLPMVDVVDALEASLRGGDPGSGPPRSSLAVGDGQLLVMPAAGAAGAGVKLVGVQPHNPERGLPFVQAVYALFDADTLTPRALIHGGELTRIRTAAVSGLATRHLSRPGASQLVVFGAGVQARAHVESMRAVRPIARVTVVGRTPPAADSMVRDLVSAGIDAHAGDSGAVRGADIVCTCTTAAEPLFDGELLSAGAHINAVGSFQPQTREIDSRTVAAGRVVVEDRLAALEEAGDLIIPIAEGSFTAEAICADIGELVRGAGVRRDERDVTVFKSVGLAWEDLVVAVLAAARMSPP